MAWDSSRPVPWQRLVRDWLLYVAIMLLLFVLVFRDRMSAGLVAGLLVSGPLFVGIGALLAKLGYQRKTLRDLRSERTARTARPVNAAAPARGRPAPTRRTSTGPRHRPTSKRKR
ncbi:MAG: hypothetical protein HZB15_14730 [Actinobacteria bacterium]|nr:hypothetical protein [Actinomycetota bacterium]